MIIKSLKLINFRQFKGTVDINFSIDSYKKATIIMAENTAGKTTLQESFSWILYGTTKLKTIWNTDLLKKCETGESVRIEGCIVLMHNNVDYTIKRVETKWKSKVTFSNGDPFFEVSYIDDQGINQVKTKKDAARLINTIIPKDLFPYFFFKGEQIEKIGKDMTEVNKSVESKEFIRAVRGLLGFNYLYEMMRHLKNVSNDYNLEISKNKKDESLAKITTEILYEKQEIEKNVKILEGYEDKEGLHASLRNYEKEKEKISDEIASFKAAEIKQKRTLDISKELETLDSDIDKKRKEIFEKFSSRSVYFFVQKLNKIAEDTLIHEDAIDKGIPNMDSKSLDYILNIRKKCLCGCELILGNEAYNNVEEFRKYLPPVGIGTEIETYKSFISQSKKSGVQYYDDFKEIREELSRKINKQKKLKAEQNQLNEEIANIPDVTKLKEEERNLSDKIVTLNVTIRSKEDSMTAANRRIEELNKEKERYSTTDTHIQKLLLYQSYCDAVYDKTNRYCQAHEKEKCKELQDTINSIFKEIFDADIQLILNDKYELLISDRDKHVLEDLETSTSQEGIMAFSFIAGIIALAGKVKKSKDSDTDLDEEIFTEPYPLVMDAPSSSFDKKRIKAFSNVLPKIAEQVIIFIKDTDGEYLEQDLGDNVGLRYEIIKHDKHYSSIGAR